MSNYFMGENNFNQWNLYQATRAFPPVDGETVPDEVAVADVPQVDETGPVRLVDGNVLHVLIHLPLQHRRHQPLTKLTNRQKNIKVLLAKSQDTAHKKNCFLSMLSQMQPRTKLRLLLYQQLISEFPGFKSFLTVFCSQVEAMLGSHHLLPRHEPLFSSLHHRATATFFHLKFSRHHLSATAPLEFGSTVQYFRGKNLRHRKCVPLCHISKIRANFTK